MEISPGFSCGQYLRVEAFRTNAAYLVAIGGIHRRYFPAWRGESVGVPLVSQPKVRMTSLTGDVSTGQRILETAANGVKRTHLELGGKAPVIVFKDADIAATIAGLRSFGYYNAGQDCTAACRLYVEKKIYDRFVADFSAAVSTIKVGSPREEGIEMGPLISERQRGRVASFVQRGGGTRAYGSYMRRKIP